MSNAVRRVATAFLAVFFVGVVGVSVASAAVVAGPKVSAFSPASGSLGTRVVITGSGFMGATSVQFGGTEGVFTVDSSTQITAIVPVGAVAGTIQVASNLGVDDSTQTFKVLPGVSSLAPTSLAPGGRLVITGSGFTGATGVKFGGVAATSFTVDSDSQISVIVPSGAKSGGIQVTTPLGSGTSSSFTVLPLPSWFHGINITSGKAGDQIEFTVDASLDQTAEQANALALSINGSYPNGWGTAPGIDGSPAHHTIVFKIPAGATSGYITFVSGGVGYTVPTWFTITS